MPKMTPAGTTALIPFYNNRATLSTAVRSILACKPGVESILLVDDGSNDGSAETVQDLPVRIIRTQHKGRAAALNAGLAEIQGGLVLFTDADCLVPCDWVGKLTGALRDHYAGVGGNLLPSRFSALEIAKLLPYLDEFAHTFELSGSYNGICLNGNNMAIRYEALSVCGGFDENYIHGADAALTRALLDKGYKLARTPHVITHHLQQETLLDFLRTRFVRGSTVRFAIDQPQESLVALGLAPLKKLIKDVGNISGLGVLGGGASFALKGAPACLVNFAGEIVHMFGKAYYRARFLKEGNR